MNSSCVLIIDDRDDIRSSARFVLEDNGYQVLGASGPGEAKELLQKKLPDLILLDMNFTRDTTSGDEGLAFLSWLENAGHTTPVVAMTAWSNVSLAVEAMRRGAGDFLEKPWKNQRLLQIIRQQLALTDLKIQNQKLQQRLEPVSESDYQWRSDCMIQLIGQVERVADTDVSILLTGDNGTGKSWLAKHIHEMSANRSGPFISVNMGGISETLFESEMFGHKKGAFTDAKSDRIGRFELGKQGTLFLDELANIPLSQQVKLLRVLESGEYEVLGSSRTLQTDVRIISATNSDLKKLIAQEKFREDLLYRLNILEFRLPSLAERREDIIPLAEHYLANYCHKYHRDKSVFDRGANPALEIYHWPGNFRELSHLMQRAVLLASDGAITQSSLNIVEQAGDGRLPQITLEQAERTLITQALSATDNNITKAAALLGLTKPSLYRRFEKYGDLQNNKS